jgi:hypothetical protein
MYSSAPPEIFMFMGINVFLVMSFSISIFEEQFSKALPYVLQIAALAGFGQIWMNYTLFSAAMDTRFWSSLFYLAMAIISVIVTNMYVGIRKKKLSSAGIIMGVFTIPVSATSFFVISEYTNGISISMPMLPIVPLRFLGAILVGSMIILGFSIFLYLKPGKLKKTFAKQNHPKPGEITLQTHLSTDETKHEQQEAEVKNIE